MVSHGKDFFQRAVICDEGTEQKILFRVLLLPRQLIAPDAVVLRPAQLDLLLHAADTLKELSGRKRFQKIIRHSKGNGLLGIDKFIVSGKNDNGGIGKLLPNQRGKFQSIHKRHLDIGQEDIRPGLENHRPGELAVTGLADKFDIFLFPVDLPLDSIAHHDLIFDEE